MRFVMSRKSYSSLVRPLSSSHKACKKVVEVNGISITFYLSSTDRLWVFKATVFSDTQYIPPSVRQLVQEQNNCFLPSLYINELEGTVEFQDEVLEQDFDEKLILFSYEASEWRDRLWERGQKDLLPVYVK